MSSWTTTRVESWTSFEKHFAQALLPAAGAPNVQLAIFTFLFHFLKLSESENKGIPKIFSMSYERKFWIDEKSIEKFRLTVILTFLNWLRSAAFIVARAPPSEWPIHLTVTGPEDSRFEINLSTSPKITCRIVRYFDKNPACSRNLFPGKNRHWVNRNRISA